MIRFAPDIDPQSCIIRGARYPRFGKIPWRLFVALYQADLEDGNPRSAEQLAEALGPHGGKLRSPETMRRHLRDLQWALDGSRFAVAGELAQGWRLIVIELPVAAPAVCAKALDITSPASSLPALGNDPALRLLAAFSLLATTLLVADGRLIDEIFRLTRQR
ncbi:MAG: hypothetical protein ACREDL_17040 [Bradyrhizobium sp.]